MPIGHGVEVFRPSVHVVAEFQEVCSVGVATAYSRTPKESFFAIVVEFSRATLPVASRQHRECVGVRAIAIFSFIIIPTTRGLKHHTRSIEAANCGKQCAPFRRIWQMPTFRANAAHRECRRATFIIAAVLSICAPRSHAVHRGSPRVKTTISGAVGRVIAIAPTSGIGGVTTIYISVFIGNTSVGIVQILCHPRLRTDSDRLVGLAIAGVC